MSNVIDFNEWRGRLGAIRQRTCLRRPRRGQEEGRKLRPTGSDASDELLALLRKSPDEEKSLRG